MSPGGAGRNGLFYDTRADRAAAASGGQPGSHARSPAADAGPPHPVAAATVKRPDEPFGGGETEVTNNGNQQHRR